MFRNFYHFYNPSIGRKSGQFHTVLYQCLTVVVIYLIAMTVALPNLLGAIKFVSLRIFVKDTGICA